MQELTEVRKEDDLFYQGAFWIIGDSIDEIKKNNFKLLTYKLLSDYNGNYAQTIESKNSLSHRRLWDDLNPFEDKTIPWNFYPRGRVAIYNGTAYIHIHSLFNQPSIIDKIIEEYGVDKLDIFIDMNDTNQGSHYDFLLS